MMRTLRDAGSALLLAGTIANLVLELVLLPVYRAVRDAPRPPAPEAQLLGSEPNEDQKEDRDAPQAE